MSYKHPYEPPGSRFRESLTFEDIVKAQIQKCLQAQSVNDLAASAAATRGLVNLVTPKMGDKDYLAKMVELDEDWKADQKTKAAEYLKRMREAEGGCPDLVAKPSVLPGQQYWEDAFAICLGLFERRGLLMKFAVVDPL